HDSRCSFSFCAARSALRSAIKLFSSPISLSSWFVSLMVFPGARGQSSLFQVFVGEKVRTDPVPLTHFLPPGNVPHRWLPRNPCRRPSPPDDTHEQRNRLPQIPRAHSLPSRVLE